MQWWGWIIVGGLLLGAAITFVDLQFYMVFVGLYAVIVTHRSMLQRNDCLIMRSIYFASRYS